MSRYVLEAVQFVPVPREGLFEVVTDPSNLAELTPAFLKFQVVTPLPSEMREGTLLEYHLTIYGRRQGWVTIIDEWDPPNRFVDVQMSGPYRFWKHTHVFRAVPFGTFMYDQVEYDLPLGPAGWLVHGLLVRNTLIEIFQYRRTQIQRLCSMNRQR